MANVSKAAVMRVLDAAIRAVSDAQLSKGDLAKVDLSKARTAERQAAGCAKIAKKAKALQSKQAINRAAKLFYAAGKKFRESAAGNRAAYSDGVALARQGEKAVQEAKSVFSANKEGFVPDMGLTWGGW